MSGAAASQVPAAAKAITDDTRLPSQKATNPSSVISQVEEDDEFEDFPVEDWPEPQSSLPEGNTHLWEESWDDDNNTDDFAKLLQEELRKVETSGKS